MVLGEILQACHKSVFQTAYANHQLFALIVVTNKSVGGNSNHNVSFIHAGARHRHSQLVAWCTLICHASSSETCSRLLTWQTVLAGSVALASPAKYLGM